MGLISNLNIPTAVTAKMSDVQQAPQVEAEKPSVWSQVGEFFQQVGDFINQNTVPDIENQGWKDFQEAMKEAKEEEYEKAHRQNQQTSQFEKEKETGSVFNSPYDIPQESCPDVPDVPKDDSICKDAPDDIESSNNS